jgi:hypothetical protein
MKPIFPNLGAVGSNPAGCTISVVSVVNRPAFALPYARSASS